MVREHCYWVLQYCGPSLNHVGPAPCNHQGACFTGTEWPNQAMRISLRSCVSPSVGDNSGESVQSPRDEPESVAFEKKSHGEIYHGSEINPLATAAAKECVEFIRLHPRFWGQIVWIYYSVRFVFCGLSCKNCETYPTLTRMGFVP